MMGHRAIRIAKLITKPNKTIKPKKTAKKKTHVNEAIGRKEEQKFDPSA